MARWALSQQPMRSRMGPVIGLANVTIWNRDPNTDALTTQATVYTAPSGGSTLTGPLLTDGDGICRDPAAWDPVERLFTGGNTYLDPGPYAATSPQMDYTLFFEAVLPGSAAAGVELQANKSNDPTFVSDSAVQYPTVHAVKSRFDAMQAMIDALGNTQYDVTAPQYGGAIGGDWTVAGQAAADDAKTGNGGGTVVWPAGLVYPISGTIDYGPRVTALVLGKVQGPSSPVIHDAMFSWAVPGNGGRGANGGMTGSGQLLCNRGFDWGIHVDSWHGGRWGEVEINDAVEASVHYEADLKGGTVGGTFPNSHKDLDAARFVGLIQRTDGSCAAAAADELLRPKRFVLGEKGSDLSFEHCYVEGLAPDGIGYEIVDGGGRVKLYNAQVFDNTRAYAGAVLFRVSSAGTADQLSNGVTDAYFESQMGSNVNNVGGYSPGATVIKVDDVQGFKDSGTLSFPGSGATASYTGRNKVNDTFTGVTALSGAISDNDFVVQGGWTPYGIKCQVDSGAGFGIKYHRFSGQRTVSTVAGCRRLWLNNANGAANRIRGVKWRDPRNQLAQDGQILIGAGCGFNYIETIDSGTYPYHVTDNGNNNVIVSLTEARPLVIYAKNFGQAADGVTDDAPAIQAALDYALSSGFRGDVIVEPGTSILASTVVVQGTGISLVGRQGELSTILKASHSAGPVIQVKDRRDGLRHLVIDATTARKTGAAGSNYGVLIEANDVAGSRPTYGEYDNVYVMNQPNHGMLAIGGIWFSHFHHLTIRDNLGHGLVINDGSITTRANKEQPGEARVEYSEIFNNSGHGIIVGSDNGVSNRGFRLHFENCDLYQNAEAAGTRKSADQMWAFMDTSTIENCAFDGKDQAQTAATTRGLLVYGKANTIRENRFLNVTANAIRIGGTLNGFTTEGVKIDGFYVSGDFQNPLDPAVTVDSDVVSCRVWTQTSTNIARLLNNSALVALERRQVMAVKVSADSPGFTGTGLIDDPDLQIPVQTNDRIQFRATIFFDGPAAGDLLLAFNVPAGSTLRWAPANGIKVDAADAVVPQGSINASDATITFGAGGVGTVRSVELVGQLLTGATAGVLKLRKAQATTDAANTRIFGQSVLQAIR